MENNVFNRIGVLRAERNLSRQDLAEAVGVNYQTIGFLERGDYSPSLALALDLGAFFKLPLEAIFSKKPFRPLSEQLYRMNGTSGGLQLDGSALRVPKERKPGRS